MSSNRGRSIRLFLVDGVANGLIKAEIINWTGQAFVVPRTGLATFLKRKEALNTAIYLLSGPDPDDPFGHSVYIGESEEVGTRLRQHDADSRKDFFERAIVFMSKDENLTKAHARYLEARLTERIRNAGRTKPMNGNEPGGAALPEADLSDMESFIDQIELILPVLGLDILRPIVRISPALHDEIRDRIQGPGEKLLSENDAERATFVFEVGNARATGREVGGEFVVLSGSLARGTETPTLAETYKILRSRLKKDGSLTTREDGMLFLTRDVPFNSPTAAAAVVYGASISGPANWYVENTKKTYATWRSERLASIPLSSE